MVFFVWYEEITIEVCKSISDKPRTIGNSTYSLHGAESFFKGRRVSASQEIPRNLRNPKVQLPHSQEPATCPYREPALSNTPTSHLLGIHINIKLSSTLGSPKTQ
jgi:hypothetical protein